jgi:outer membrane protein
MRGKVFAALVVCMTVLFAAGVHAEEAKVGIVDMQKVLDTSSAGKGASDKLKARGDQMEAELKKKEDQITVLRKSLESERAAAKSSGSVNREALEKKERDLGIMVMDIKSLQKRYLEEFREMEAQLTNRIRDDVFALIEELGRQGGFTLIMEKREGGVLFSPNTLDITDQVVAEYNKRAAK